MGLINTLDRPSEFDAAAKLRPDEPYFLLIGRDRSAPELVQQWADNNRKRALSEREDMSEEELDEELRKSTDAERIAWDMQAYKRGELRKEAKREEGTRPTYNDHELPEATARRDRIQRARTSATAALLNARAELVNLAEVLARDGAAGDGSSRLSKRCSRWAREIGEVAGITAMPRPVLKR